MLDGSWKENKIIDEELEQLQQDFLNQLSKYNPGQKKEAAIDESVELGRIDSHGAEDENHDENSNIENGAGSDSALETVQTFKHQANKSDKPLSESLEKMQNGIDNLKKEIYYFLLLKMKENFDPQGMAQEELKELAVILNSFSGLLLIVINGVLLFYTGLVVLTDYNGIDSNL